MFKHLSARTNQSNRLTYLDDKNLPKIFYFLDLWFGLWKQVPAIGNQPLYQLIIV